MAKKVIEINETPFYQAIQYTDSKNGLTTDTTFKLTTDFKTYVNFQPVNAGDITHDSYYIKDGNDLKFVTVYYDGNTYAVKKKVTMTILDYATHYNVYEDVMHDGGSPIQPSDFYIQSKGEARVGKDALYAGTDKADKFTIAGGGSETVDFKGNDSYNVALWGNAASSSRIYDYAGNDKYSISVLPKTKIESVNYGGEAKVAIDDYSGNDTYTLKDARKEPDEAGINAAIYDYNGNDKYNVNGANKVSILESNKGKDTYNISNTVDATVYDWGGNDIYNVANSKITIKENMSASSSDEKGTPGNETYNLNALLASSKVYDLRGNDKYNINYAQGEEAGAKKITIIDLDGKDTYKITASKHINLTDQNGNDTYNIIDSDKLNISDGTNSADNPQNETYTLKTVSNSTLEDTFGNDSYKIDLSVKTSIDNWGGTDKYTVTNSNGITIEDNANKTSGTALTSYADGNDTFTVKDSIETAIYSGQGDDKFTVSDDAVRTTILDAIGNDKYDIKDSALVKILDKSGDDTYKLTNVDNYNIQVSGTQTDEGALNYNIRDNVGNDKYDIKNSRSIYVYDNTTTEGEKNTFNLTSNDNINIITDKQATAYSQDTYNLTSNSSATVEDYGESNDIYNITKSDAKSDIQLTDKKGNDTYNIDKLVGKVTIADEAGTEDTLIIKGAKEKDIVFMADAETDGGALFAYDQKAGGYAKIVGYYKDIETMGGQYGEDHIFSMNGYGDGKIETVKFGKKDADVTTYETMNQLQEAVTTFLTSEEAKGYSTIEKVLNSGDSDVIEGLIACFNPQA